MTPPTTHHVVFCSCPLTLSLLLFSLSWNAKYEHTRKSLARLYILTNFLLLVLVNLLQHDTHRVHEQPAHACMIQIMNSSRYFLQEKGILEI